MTGRRWEAKQKPQLLGRGFVFRSLAGAEGLAHPPLAENPDLRFWRRVSVRVVPVNAQPQALCAKFAGVYAAMIQQSLVSHIKRVH